MWAEEKVMAKEIEEWLGIDKRIELSGEERASRREWEKKRARRKYYQKRATKCPGNCAVSEQKLR